MSGQSADRELVRRAGAPRRNRAPVAPRGRAVAVAASLATWLIPRRAGYRLTDLVAHLAYLGLGRYRRAALANVSQALTELPRAAPPNEGLVLVVGLLAGVGVAMLFSGFMFRAAGRRLEQRLVVYLAGQASLGASAAPVR